MDVSVIKYVIVFFSDDGSNSNLLNIYNRESGEIVIPSFKVRSLSPDLEFLIRVPDHVILQNFSTSPKVEPPHFASEIRDSLKIVFGHPNIETTLFHERRPRIYRRSQSTGQWTLVLN